MAGKGDRYRKVDRAAWERGWERAFGKPDVEEFLLELERERERHRREINEHVERMCHDRKEDEQ